MIWAEYNYDTADYGTRYNGDYGCRKRGTDGTFPGGWANYRNLRPGAQIFAVWVKGGKDGLMSGPGFDKSASGNCIGAGGLL